MLFTFPRELRNVCGAASLAQIAQRDVSAPHVGTSGGGVGLGPGDQVVGGHRVDDALGLDAHPGGLVAAVGLPLELAGRVGVGVDGDAAVPVEGELRAAPRAGPGARGGS